MREHERFALSHLFNIDATISMCVTSVSWVSKPFDVHKEPFATYAATNSPHCCELGVTPPPSEELQGM